MRRKRFEWWHGLVFYAGVQVAQWGIRAAARAWNEKRGSGIQRADRALYRAQKLPVFAPPGAAFPIAWSINSVSAIVGGLYVLNLSRWKRGRKEFLWLQGGAWILFTLFDAAYFELRSPINAAAITFAYTGVTMASINTALWKMKEPKVALALGTTLAWLAIANPVAVAQAAWNHDPFWDVGPLAKPPKRWLKPR